MMSSHYVKRVGQADRYAPLSALVVLALLALFGPALPSCSAFNNVSDAETRDGAVVGADPDAGGGRHRDKTPLSSDSPVDNGDAGQRAGSDRSSASRGADEDKPRNDDEIPVDSTANAPTTADAPSTAGNADPIPNTADSAVPGPDAPSEQPSPDTPSDPTNDATGEDGGSNCGSEGCVCLAGSDLGDGGCSPRDDCEPGDSTCVGVARCAERATGNRCVCPGYYRDQYGDASSCLDYRVLGAVGYGGDDFTLGYGVATDSLGYPILAGAFAVSTSIGNVRLVGSGSHDVFIGKLDRSISGNASWVRRFGAGGDDRGYHLAVDASDDVLMIGSIDGAVAFDAFSLGSSGPAAFVIKLDGADGRVKWARTLPWAGDFDKEESWAWDVAVDGQDNIYVLGGFAAAFDFGTSDGTIAPAGSTDAFLLKYSPDGVPVWVRTLGAANGFTAAVALAVDSRDNIVVTGLLGGETQLFPNAPTGFGNEDAFVVKINPGGEPLWGLRFGAAGYDRGNSLALGADDRVYVAGVYHGEMTLGDRTLPAGPSQTLFLAELDPEGELQWVTRAPSGHPALSAHALVKLPDGLAVAGDFSTTLSFEDGTVLRSTSPKDDPQDMYVARFGLDGSLQWAQSFGGDSYDEIRDAVLDQDGKLLATGWYHGPATVGARTLYTRDGFFFAPILRVEP